MHVERANRLAPTPEELNDLKKLKTILEQAIADGVITSSEMETFKSHIWADGKITPQELELYRDMVISKIRRGELVWGFDSYDR